MKLDESKIFKHLYSNKSSWLLFFGLSLFVFLTYLPLLQSYFVWNDDYYIYTMTKGVCSSWRQHHFLTYQIGRPLLSFLFCWQTFFTKTLQDANLVRAITIFYICIIAYLLYLWLNIHFKNKKHSILLSLIIVTLPPFQVFASNIGCQAVAISILLTIGSAIIIYKYAFDYIDKKGNNIKKYFNKYSITAVVMLLISFLIYPTTTMFFWVMVGIFILNISDSNWRKNRTRIYYLLGVNIVATLIFFLYLKINFIIYMNGPKLGHTWTYDIVLTNNIKQKILWFISEPLNDALNLWNIKPSSLLALISSLIIIIGIIIGIINSLKGQSTPKLIIILIEKYALLFSFLPLSFLPNLAAGNTDQSSYRSILSLTCLIIILLYWSLKNILELIKTTQANKILTYFLIIICLLCTYKAHHNVMNYFVFAQELEIKYIVSAINQNELKNYKRIHIISPNKASLVAPQNMKEFAGIVGLYNVVLYSLLPDLDNTKKMQIENILKNDKFSWAHNAPPEKNEEPTLIIDLSELYYFY